MADLITNTRGPRPATSAVPTIPQLAPGRGHDLPGLAELLSEQRNRRDALKGRAEKLELVTWREMLSGRPDVSSPQRRSWVSGRVLTRNQRSQSRSSTNC